ncbi:LapA family protein [Anabaena sp. PCC 7108]|uniref:LapA family protein n=1 Tax=Anabaena sp. PCC 7108 TaxID=163908 RepID=UPI0003495D40|nr:LapA family protein [Anabaena sp. PCC 7108]
MKSFVNLLISIVIAVWVIAIALISVQNATPVSLRFLIFQSIQIPFGLVLAFCVAVGLIGVAILQPFWELGASKSSVDEEAEFFLDDEDF